MKIKLLFILIILSLFTGCESRREKQNRLDGAMKNADKALVSSDREFIKESINELGSLYEVFPESRSLRHKKATLEIRLRDYDAAIETFNNLLEINPDEIEFRIPLAIIQEINGHRADSRKTLKDALYYLDLKIKAFEESDKKIGEMKIREEKYYSRRVNRVLILKLLGQDSEETYYEILEDNRAHDYPEVIKAITLLKNSRKEELISKYR